MRIDSLKLLMGRKILFNKEHDLYVHQPMISEIVDMGEDEYNKLILPFIITTDVVFNGAENEELLINKYNIFDLFFIQGEDNKTVLDGLFERSSQEVLEQSLEYFLRFDSIRFLKNRKKIIVNDKFMIDENNFKDLRMIIQAVTCRSDIEVEKPPKNMTKRQSDIWKKLQKGRKRTSEKNAVYTQDMINFVHLGSEQFIPLREIDKMTYYQFQNSYKGILSMDAYKMGMQYKLSQKFEVKDDVKHWTETLKIGR